MGLQTGLGLARWASAAAGGAAGLHHLEAATAHAAPHLAVALNQAQVEGEEEAWWDPECHKNTVQRAQQKQDHCKNTEALHSTSQTPQQWKAWSI
jgi:hypothetical protein